MREATRFNLGPRPASWALELAGYGHLDKPTYDPKDQDYINQAGESYGQVTGNLYTREEREIRRGATKIVGIGATVVSAVSIGAGVLQQMGVL